ncbi:MAG: lamin tail domain-containing protein [Patescibacteria group bacterium]
MRIISLNQPQKLFQSAYRQTEFDFVPSVKKNFPLLTVIQKSNKGLFLFLMMVIALLPAGWTNATFYSEATVGGSEFTTGCWVQPSSPLLVSLPDNAVIHQGNAWLSNPLMTWDASDTTCPTGQLQYQFRVATDAGFTNVVETSGWLNVPQFVTSATGDGEYYWEVTARDSAHLNITPVTTPSRHYTVDSSTLQAPNNLGWNIPTQSVTPNENPLDLACGATTDGGNPASPTVSHNWSAVSGTNIKYQREVTYPNGSTIGFFYETNTYTPFSSFGAPPGIEGLWKTRVKAFEDDNSNGVIDSGERTSDFSNYCNITLDLNPAAPAQIVLNEILPNPQGIDNAALPFGEWVELYNRSDSDVNINNWVIYADAANQFPLVISSANTFPDVAVGVGTTIIPSHGRLVVYRAGDANFDLADSGDTVSLYNGLVSGSGQLQDSHTYGDTRENKSLTRSPDGADNWVDPIPSPGRPNVLDESQLEPFAIINEQDGHHAVVALLEGANYQTADMVIEYTRKQDGEEVSEALTKQISIGENIQFYNDIFLGSMSSGAENPHTGIKNLKVHMTLHSNNLPDKTIDAQMNGKWRLE